MNLFIFTGNLGGDAEVKPVGETQVAEFSVAVKAGYGQNEQTLWMKCGLWGKRAEGKLIDYLKKGQQVAVSGELSTNEWTTQNGEARTDLRIRVNDVTLLGKAGNSDTPPSGKDTPAEDFDDDVPF